MLSPYVISVSYSFQLASPSIHLKKGMRLKFRYQANTPVHKIVVVILETAPPFQALVSLQQLSWLGGPFENLGIGMLSSNTSGFLSCGVLFEAIQLRILVVC